MLSRLYFSDFLQLPALYASSAWRLRWLCLCSISSTLFSRAHPCSEAAENKRRTASFLILFFSFLKLRFRSSCPLAKKCCSCDFTIAIPFFIVTSITFHWITRDLRVDGVRG